MRHPQESRTFGANPDPESRISVPQELTREQTAAYEAALASFGERRGVIGIDVGFTYVNGTMTNTVAVRVHRNPADRPWDAALDALPPSLEDVPLYAMDVAYGLDVGSASGSKSTPSPTFVAPKRRRLANPLQPGFAIAGQQRPAGTLGLIVFDDAGVYALSNAHVLAVEAGETDRVVHQPAKSGSKFEVGKLARAVASVRADAAIAKLDTGRRICRAQFSRSHQQVVITDVRRVLLGDTLGKSGAETGESIGIVDGIGRYYFGMTAKTGTDGFRIVPATNAERLSDGGDSGAVWYSVQGQTGIGLHKGGFRGGAVQVAIACHLEQVLTELGVRITPTASFQEQCGPTP